MDFPRTIKIGYRDYEIVARPHLDAAQAGRDNPAVFAWIAEALVGAS